VNFSVPLIDDGGKSRTEGFGRSRQVTDLNGIDGAIEREPTDADLDVKGSVTFTKTLHIF
jgi:hypothetical protein